jgi:hypothetical protein
MRPIMARHQSLNFLSGIYMNEFYEDDNKEYITVSGLDCSSTICGASTFYIEKKTKKVILKEYFYHKFSPTATPINKSFDFLYSVYPKIKDSDYIALEDALVGHNKTHPTTMMKLTHINATVEYMMHFYHGADKFQKINVNTARKLVIGNARTSTHNGKELAINYCINEVEGFELKFKKTGKIKDEYFDMADSIIIALADAKLRKLI